ncbi:MAG: ABC transporter permease [Firmicutes bacterium]|nr:ABC transporter permease [Bacillota bacterium]
MSAGTPVRRWGAIGGVFFPVLSVLLALVVGSIVAAATGYNPLGTIGALVDGAFGDPTRIAATLSAAIPLMIVGLGVAVTFQAGLFNIGAEGQYWIGALAATYVGYAISLPPILHILACFLAAMIAAGIWAGLIPGLAKAYRGANEVITTMMLSYVAIYLGQYLVESGPMKAPGTLPQSPIIAPSATLPILVQPQFSAGIFVAIVAAAVLWWLFYRSSWGYQLRTIGRNPVAARYAGMSVARQYVLALGVSGMLAGLAGAAQILGVQHRIYDSFSSGYGYTAIAVALLGRNNPIGVVLAAILFGALTTGGQMMQINAGVDAQLANVIEGLIVFFVAAEAIIRWIQGRFHLPRRASGRPQHAETPAVVEGER